MSTVTTCTIQPIPPVNQNADCLPAHCARSRGRDITQAHASVLVSERRAQGRFSRQYSYKHVSPRSVAMDTYIQTGHAVVADYLWWGKGGDLPRGISC